MKKILFIFTLLALFISGAAIETYAQASATSLKAAKSRAKELKKEKWYCEDNKTIESALVGIAEKEAQGYRVLIGTAYGIDNQNDAAFEARDDAFQKIGELGKSIISGRVTSNRQKRNDRVSRNGDSGFDRHLMRELEGLMDTPYLTIYREKNGNFDCRIYYVVQSSLIDKAVQRAEDTAAKEMDDAKKYGESVNDFINGGGK